MNCEKKDETHLQRIRSGNHDYFCLIELPTVRCKALENSRIWDVLSAKQFNILKIDYGSPTYDVFKKQYPAFQLPCVYIFGARVSASPSIMEFSGQNISERQILRYLSKNFDVETTIPNDAQSENDSTLSLTSSPQPVQPDLATVDPGLPPLAPSAAQENPVNPQMAEAFLRILAGGTNTPQPTGGTLPAQTTNNNGSTSTTTTLSGSATTPQHTPSEARRGAQKGSSNTNTELATSRKKSVLVQKSMPKKIDITITPKRKERNSTSINRKQSSAATKKIELPKEPSMKSTMSTDIPQAVPNEDGTDPILSNAINMSLSDEVWPTLNGDEKEPLIITKAVLRKRETNYIRFGLTFPGGRMEVVRLSPQNKVQELFAKVRDLWGEQDFTLQSVFPKVRLDTEEKDSYEKTLDNFFKESLRLQVRRKNKATSSRRETVERNEAGLVSYLLSLPTLMLNLLMKLFLAFFALLGIKSKPTRPAPTGGSRTASPSGQRSSSKKQTKKKRIMRLTDLKAPGTNDKRNKYWNGNSTMYGGDGDEDKR